jgi:hypothetical protein
MISVRQLLIEFSDNLCKRLTKMTIQIDDLGRVHGARRSLVRSTMATAFAAVAALAASATSANVVADAPGTKNVWSYDFNDSLWMNSGLDRPNTLLSIAGWAPRCFVNCGPAFGTYVVPRAELLSSNAADVSVNKTADPTGHRVAVSGMIISERLEPDSLGADPNSSADWQVVAERVLDSGGTHSWSLLSVDISLDAHWLPLELYRFDGSSLSMDFVAQGSTSASAAPESSTWAMMLIGFAGLGVAGYRSSRNYRRSIDFLKGTYSR